MSIIENSKEVRGKFSPVKNQRSNQLMTEAWPEQTKFVNLPVTTAENRGKFTSVAKKPGN